ACLFVMMELTVFSKGFTYCFKWKMIVSWLQKKGMTCVKKMFSNWGRLVANSKSRWATIFIWILLIGVFSYIWPQVNDQETTDNRLLPDDAMSVEANQLQNEEFSDGAGTPLLLVWYRDGGIEPSDFELIQSVYETLDNEPLGHQTLVPPFHDMPPEA